MDTQPWSGVVVRLLHVTDTGCPDVRGSIAEALTDPNEGPVRVVDDPYVNRRWIVFGAVGPETAIFDRRPLLVGAALHQHAPPPEGGAWGCCGGAHEALADRGWVGRHLATEEVARFFDEHGGSTADLAEVQVGGAVWRWSWDTLWVFRRTTAERWEVTVVPRAAWPEGLFTALRGAQIAWRYR